MNLCECFYVILWFVPATRMWGTRKLLSLGNSAGEIELKNCRYHPDSMLLIRLANPNFTKISKNTSVITENVLTDEAT